MLEREADEGFERRVEVRLSATLRHTLKVVVVKVCVDAEQTLEDGLQTCTELGSRARLATRLAEWSEEIRVVQLRLHPW